MIGKQSQRQEETEGHLRWNLGEAGVRDVSRRSWYPSQDLKDEQVGWDRGRVAWYWGRILGGGNCTCKDCICKENMVLCRICPG